MITFKRLLLFLLGFPCFIYIYVTVSLLIVHQVKGIPFDYENNGTDLSFVSSDGRWSDQEDMLNGRNFETILVSFELYRIQCDEPNVTLIRTKPKKKPYKWAWWFDNYQSPKWKVPFKDPSQLPAQTQPPCSAAAPTQNDMSLARARADTRLNALNQVSEN